MSVDGNDKEQDYDVLSWQPGDSKWGLADVGLSRNSAIAHMVLRATRWGDWGGAYLLTDILDGRADPETPHRVPDEEFERAAWFCIVRSDGPLPPLPS